jgi:ABC-type polar amino acid transport system ATPase subunit
MIEVRGLSHAYGDGTEALRDVNVEFPGGAVSAVLGESGSGKTTLLMALSRFLPVPAGRISYDGVDINDVPEAELRRKIGVVFQKLYLFPHLTVLENLALAPVHAQGRPRAEAEAGARGMLDRLGIREVADSYPVRLSGGQAQRAAIARGLLLKPDYMLLDEPTSALDANTTDEFAAWLRELRGETNFIVVTHDVLFARRVADTGVYLSGGTVAARGPIEEVIGSLRASGGAAGRE